MALLPDFDRRIAHAHHTIRLNIDMLARKELWLRLSRERLLATEARLLRVHDIAMRSIGDHIPE